MPAEFHHLSPVILTDDLFDTFIPALTVSPTDPQKTAAYLIAEEQMVQGLMTPLLPTQVSGTFAFQFPYETIKLPHIYVRSLDSVVAFGPDGGCNCDVTDLEACGRIRNYIGWIDTRVIAGLFVRGCGSAIKPAYYDITYTAGLTTGTAANDARLHMSLSMLARLQLLEMTDPGALEGGGGDVGVQSYSTLGYSETRVKLKNTPFGSSAIANKAWNMVRHLRINFPMRFGK